MSPMEFTMSISANIYRAILMMRERGKYLEKEKVLVQMSTSPTFKRVLYQTYSPYIRYHIRKIPAKYVGKGNGELDQTTWTLLAKLSLRKITGNVARETLFEHMETLTPAAERTLRLIIKKDLKCGIAAATINKVFTGLIPVFECQLVDDWDESRVKYPILVGPKIDCVRGEFRGGNFYTRRGHKIVGVDHIIKHILSAGKSIELSGELYIPGMYFHRASGIIRSNKEEKPNVKFACFDIPALRSMPYDQRLYYMSKIFMPLGTKPQPPVVYIPHIMADDENQVSKAFNLWVSQGWEGLVGKNPSGIVRAGKGSYDWMRKVYGGEDEYLITNVYESEEVPGTLGGVIIQGNIRVGSGFVDDERKKYWGNPDLVVGKMGTIAFKEKTKAGSLRQPIWKGLRWDI